VSIISQLERRISLSPSWRWSARCHLPLTLQNQPKPVEEMTDDELESHIAAIDRYLGRHGLHTEQNLNR
jgi:hypothetical protein